MADVHIGTARGQLPAYLATPTFDGPCRGSWWSTMRTFRMMRVLGIGCDEPAASDARRRIADSFGVHLKR